MNRFHHFEIILLENQYLHHFIVKLLWLSWGQLVMNPLETQPIIEQSYFVLLIIEEACCIMNHPSLVYQHFQPDFQRQGH